MDDLNSTPEAKKSLFNFNPKDNPVAFIAFLFFAFLAFGAISVYMLNTSSQRTQEKDAKEEKVAFKSLSENTLVYGYWMEDVSQVEAFNLKTGESVNVATLPSSIKKVSVISPQKLMYINQTDVRDHGKEVVIYDLFAKKIVSVINSSLGFGIDDYVISPNKKYIAFWEVNVPDGKSLSDGKSIVSVHDINNPEVKKIIYEENLPDTTFAHYPVAVTDTGEVFMDSFHPNSGAGWANGMTFASLDGSPSAIASMPSGSYGTQPKSSPDGRFLLFAGYDGTKGSGVVSVGASDGFRQAILSPNTIELFDTVTKERKKIEGLSNQNIYPKVSWDGSNGGVIYSQIAKDPSLTGRYVYNLSALTSKKIDNARNNSIEDGYVIIENLSGGKYLAGQRDLFLSALGNLGETYLQPYSEVAVFDTADNKLTPVPIASGLVQFIDLLPSSYFASSLNSIDTAGDEDNTTRKSSDQLQLQSFVIKPKLEPIRTLQQSEVSVGDGDQPTNNKDLPQCRDVAVEQCNAMYGGDLSGDEALAIYGSGGESVGPPGYDTCFDIALYGGYTGECADSPLYLYGEENKNVSVEIGTQVSNSNAPYNNSYRGILTGDGGISINGTRYKSLEYDYVSAIKKLPILNYGKVVKQSQLKNAITDYGEKLGLNSKEIIDIIASIGHIDSPYIFVSFYDDKTSKAILPISFDPKPDVYRNIVFYLKPVNEPFVAKVPVFEKYPERQGFTAVEVSYIID